MQEEVKHDAPAPFPRKPVHHHILRFGRHGAVWTGGISLIALTLGAAGISFMAWKLSEGPIQAAIALPFIESALSRNDVSFDIGALELSWEGQQTPLKFEMKDITVNGPRGPFLTIQHADLGLSLSRLLLARINFPYAHIEGLSLRLIRLEDGTVIMTGTDAAPDEKNLEPARIDLADVVEDLPSVERLGLADTTVIFEDRKDAIVRKYDQVEIEMAQDDTAKGRSLSGFVTMPLTGIQDESRVSLDFIYDPADQKLTAAGNLDEGDTKRLIGSWLRQANLPLVDMEVDGRGQIILNNDLSVDSFAFRLKGDDGMLFWPRNYGEGLEPQKLTNFEVGVTFAPGRRTLSLDKAEITIKGITVSATGAMKVDEQWNAIEGSVAANIPVLAVDALPAVWPAVWDVGARHWLVDRMDKGRFAHINATVPLKASRAANEDGETQWQWEVGKVLADFDFTGVTVDYRSPMLPAVNTTGTGKFEDKSLTLDVTRASLGTLNVQKARLYFDDLITANAGHADLDFQMTGPVGGVFGYLEKEPISYKEKVSLDVTSAKGRADLNVNVKFPTLKTMKVEDVRVLANAKLHDLVVPGAVNGLTLAGGPYDLEATENHFKIEGKGTLAGQPATIMWHELFAATPRDTFSSKLEADLVTDAAIREKFTGDFAHRITGSVPAKISMITLPSGKADLKISATLDDAEVDFTDPLNAKKLMGTPARVNLTATLQKGRIQSIDTLTASGPGVTIASGNIAFMRNAADEPVLSKVFLKGLKIANTNADIDATWPSENVLKVAITGPSFDARGVLDNKNKKAGGKSAEPERLDYDIAIKVDRLLASDEGVLEQVEAMLSGSTHGIMRLVSIEAMADRAPTSLRYSAEGLFWDAANAGSALNAFGVTNRVRDGKLTVKATPLKNGKAGDMKGTLVLENFSVRKAPALAKLINVLSLPGLLNILNQDTGLKFARAESDLVWLNRPGGGIIQLSDGRTSGASLGLTFEGEVNTATDIIDVQGTAVPMSELNTLLSGIPLIGDILTGGKGQGIFAATYTMKGDTSNPDVSVNPLSVLTPGILRRILFEGAFNNSAPAASTPTP